MTDKVSAAPSSRIGPEQRHRSSGRGRRLSAIGLVAATSVAALVAGTIAAAASPAAANGATSGASASPQRLGAVPHAPAGAVRTGVAAASTKVDLTVGLKPRDTAALQKFITATTTKGNAQYHQYLGQGQFADTFGPTPATIAKVTAALKAQGLKPGKVSADGLTIKVSTTLDAAGRAFGTGFGTYKLADGTTGYMNSTAPQVAGSVAGYLTGVSGLSDLGRPTADHTRLPTKHTATAAGRAATGKTGKQLTVAPSVATGPQICADAKNTLTEWENPEGTGSVSDGDGYESAGNLAATYGMEHTATSGAGVTIGVFELEDFSDSDLAAYQTCYGTSVPVSRVPVDGGPTEAPDPTVNRGVESLLDLEDLASLAPGAKIIDYQGPDLDLNTFSWQDWLDTYSAMISADKASVLSMSYGACEADEPAELRPIENTYSMEAAAQGQTMLVSSGDAGATACDNGTGSANPYKQSASDPASQPYVVGVGGTTLLGNPATKRTAWVGSGGGVSVVPVPNQIDYQSGFTGKGFSNSVCAAPGGTTCREVPDVAADADPNTGYPIYVGGDWVPVGGTSGATPTWAAVIAIANTQGACKANGALGFVNPALYGAAKTAYASNFTDITTGNNSYAGTGHPGYSATAGYDMATGLGEPKAGTLSTTLCGSLPTPGAGTYHPVTPTRLLDTRQVGTGTPLPASGRTSVQVTGAKLNATETIPSTGVTSVVLNVTVTGTTSSGFLSAWGDHTPGVTTSNLNWSKGTTIANLVTVPVPGDGKIDFFVSSPAQVIVDIQGYYAKSTGGLTFTGVAPTRLIDTRQQSTTPVTNTTLNLPIRGSLIPAGAKAVVLNMTATGTVGTSGNLTAWAGGGTTPTISNVNWGKTAGTTIAGLAIVPINDDGSISIRVNGTAQVFADAIGYFSADATGSSFTSEHPTRLFDTRPNAGNNRFAAGETRSVLISGQAGIPAGVKAVVLNITVTGSTSRGFLSAWSGDTTTLPTVSSLNWGTGQTIPNQVIVPVGSNGKINLHTSVSTNVFVDVFGYFQ